MRLMLRAEKVEHDNCYKCDVPNKDNNLSCEEAQDITGINCSDGYIFKVSFIVDFDINEEI